jgi:hypothetical protein
MSRRETGALVFGRLPRADLTPPEVALQREELGRRRGLISAVIAMLALVISGVVGSYLHAASVEAQLAEERRTTEQLLVAQLEFTEITLVRGQLGSIAVVRGQLPSVEVLWSETLQP